MKKSILVVQLLLVPIFFLTGFAQDTAYQLKDFYTANPILDLKVNMIYEGLTDEQKVGQMIVPAAGKLGKSTTHVLDLVKNNKVGGILLLNGTTDEFKALVKKFDSANVAAGGLPLLYSADAELSLINMKIKGTQTVKYANKITSVKEVETETKKISDELHAMGINFNYAPVVDLSPNKTVSFRSFGLSKDTIMKYSKAFIDALQNQNIVATAKHFPGHGYVVGDTHKQLVYIDGEMKETSVYVPLIESGVISIMVGHIAVKNNEKYNTNDLPATVSKAIVTDLLKTEMGFKGIIITDAMGMGGVKSVPKNCLKAAQAGCDIVLMPSDENIAFAEMLEEYKASDEFKKQVEASVKKIIRLKICLGLI
jgi:beta-N-acetylhexosaminidase